MIARGGSNYNWIHIECCNREPYGVLKGYTSPDLNPLDSVDPPTKRELVQTQLDQLYTSGQHRLRIMIYHAPEGTGTVLVPSDPVEEWLGAFLADVKAVGFKEIMVAMGPQGKMSVQDEWEMLYKVRELVSIQSIHYRIDLSNESSVPSTHSRFARRKIMWSWYLKEFGKADTVGFSIPLDHLMADRIASLKELYSGDMPYLFSVHSYGYVIDEYTELLWLDNLLNEHGHSQGIIIGECLYNDRKSAQRIQDAIKDLSRPVYYLCQWPMNRHGLCKHVDIAPPVKFGEYLNLE